MGPIRYDELTGDGLGSTAVIEGNLGLNSGRESLLKLPELGSHQYEPQKKRPFMYNEYVTFPLVPESVIVRV